MSCAHAFGEVCSECAQATVDSLGQQTARLLARITALETALAARDREIRGLVETIRGRQRHHEQRGREYPLEALSGAKWRHIVAEQLGLVADDLARLLPDEGTKTA